MGVFINFQMFRIRVWRCYRTCKSSGHCGTRLIKPTEVLGTGIKFLLNFQNFPVRYESLTNRPQVRVLWLGYTELPEVPGRYNHAVPVRRVVVTPRYRTPRNSAGMSYTSCRSSLQSNTPGMVCVYPTERTKIERPGTGMNAVQNSQTFRARVELYRTHRRPGYG